MKTFSLLSVVFFAAACSRDTRQAAAPKSQATVATTSAPTNAPTQDFPDLNLHMVQVDGLPTSEFLDPGAAKKQPVQEAIAVMHPTNGSNVKGLVRFVNVEGRGIEVFAQIAGLSNGMHAYHIHVYGDCSGVDAKTAGPHFHYTGSWLDENPGYITGNLGVLRGTGDARMATHNAKILDASLQGEFSIIGRAVVIHQRGNDPDVTPDGGAGERLACGVIGVANPGTPRTAAGYGH